MLEEPQPPLYMRGIAGALTLLRTAGIEMLSLHPEVLLREACKRTGLQETMLGDLEVTALNKLCESAEQDAQLHSIGRYAVREVIVSALSNRLLRVEHGQREPERFHAPLHKPLLVIGLPRSGTTLLHRLLALANDARPLHTWELQRPLAPVRGVDRRRCQVQRQLQGLHTIVPSVATKHEVGVDDAEEDFWLLNSTLLSATFFVFSPCFGYERWWRDQDMFDAYADWASHLSHFQSDSPQHRLVLKAPIHTAFVAEVLAAVPNMTLVQIHRDPEQVVGSLNSLIHTLYAAVSNWRDPVELGRLNLDRLRWLAERNLAQREHATSDIIDVQYDDLKANPIDTVSDIHEQIGVEFSAEHRQRITAHMCRRPEHAFGKHLYSLDECALSREVVYRELAAYTERFAHV